MPRRLSPNEWNSLRTKLGLTPQNEGQYVTRQGDGIYLKDDVNPEAPQNAGAGPANDAELWQMLNGGQLAENPYLPYLMPQTIERDGKKFLRIPKNQQLVDLAKFFDQHGQQQYENTALFVNDFTKWKLNKQETDYQTNKPYYAPRRTPTPTVTSKTRQNAYDENGRQIGFAIFDPKTAQTTYVNLGGNQSLDPSKVARVGGTASTVTDTTTDQSSTGGIEADLRADIQAGFSLSELYGAYPELSASQIKAIYDQTAQ